MCCHICIYEQIKRGVSRFVVKQSRIPHDAEIESAHVSVRVHLAVFRKGSMNAVGVATCGNPGLRVGAGGNFGTVMNRWVPVGPIRGQGPWLRAQTKAPVLIK